MRAEGRHPLDPRSAGAVDPDALVGGLGQSARMVAPGVVVIPAARVEGMALEFVDAGDGGQFRSVERTGSHHDETGPHRIAAIGRDYPARRVLVPAQFRHPRLETCVVVEVVMLCDTPRVLVDLGREGVLLLRHVAELFDQRQIAVAFDVALGARIAVPVPGATEVAAGLDDSNLLDPGFVEARAGQQSAETSTDDYYIDLVVQRGAIKRFDIR